MQVNFRIKRNTKLYCVFTLINLEIINTFQVWSINFTLCNLTIQILKIKK